MSTEPVYIGIDVAKAELVIATPTGELCRVANDAAGITRLLEHLRPLAIAAVVMESTGCYGREATARLTAAGLPVAIVQAGRVRHFAASLGVRAKSDPIDARIIACFAAATKPRSTPPPADEVARIRALVDRRDQIIEMRKQEENRLESVADPLIAKDLRASIKRLRAAEQAYDKRMAEQIAAYPALRRISDRLQEESGVGPQTAAVLLAHFPELGTINRQRAAALAGLAPYARSSGTYEGKRSIYGGRARIRKALYLAAVSAVRWSSWLKDAYVSMRAKGKCAKVALIACARKLLVRLNSLAADAIRADSRQDASPAS